MNTWLSILFIFFVSFSLFFLVMMRIKRRKVVEHRLEVFVPENQVAETDPESLKNNNVFKMFITSMGKLLRGITFSEGTKTLLSEAGTELKPEEYLVLRIFISLGAGLITWIIDLNLYLIIALIIVGFMYPHYYMKRKRKKRLSILSYQLIETLGIMSNSLRAGFSFLQAMQLAGKETPEPLGPELERAVREASLGIPIEKVFESMMHRLPNKELEVVIRAILAQRRSGGNLAELMETMEDTIRVRIRVLEELRTLTAQGRMSSWIITLLPVGLGLYLYFAGDGYFTPMLKHPLGWLMLGLSAVAIVVGWIVIRKIIKVEV